MHLSTDNIVRHSSRSALIALWVVLCLLFAQGLGYAHAISHAGSKTETLISQTSLASASTTALDHKQASSACATLEAATLAAGLHSLSLLPLILTLPVPDCDSIVVSVWQQSFAAFFSSRAPPFFH